MTRSACTLGLLVAALGGCGGDTASLPPGEDGASTSSSGATDDDAGAQSGAGGHGGSSSSNAGTGGSNPGGSGPAPVCPEGESYGSPLANGSAASEVATGIDFLEGPVWLGDRLWFSDMSFSGGGPDNVPPSTIHQLVDGSVSTAIADSGSNGLAIDQAGMVVACTHDERSVSLFDPTSLQRTTLVDDYMGMKFNSPNDATVRSDGTVYFTDPTWQLGNRPQETPYKGVYRLPPNGSPVLIADDFSSPNGIVLSPDEQLLYVADDGKGLVERFTVAADGSTSEREQFVMASGADGMSMDCAGNLYVTAHTGVMVVAPDGSTIGTITLADKPANCVFGGDDRKTLYITAGTTLYAITLAVPGL